MNSNVYEPPKKRKKLAGNKETSKKTKRNENVNLVEKHHAPESANLLSINDECMFEILKHLNIMDLFGLSKINSRLRTVISTRVIAKKIIDFDELPGISCEEVFEMFGKYMVEIKIGEKHVTNTESNRSKFDEILHQIRTRCSDGLLRHVEFQFCNSTTIISEAIIEDVLPSLKNIESFEMSEPTSNPSADPSTHPLLYNFVFAERNLVNDSVNSFINCVLKNSTNIKSAKFQNFRITGEWLLFHHMQAVEILSFVNCTLEKNGCLIAFMQRKPTLRSFTWRYSSVDRVSDSANFVLDLVGNNVPLLRTLNFERNRGYFENNLYVPKELKSAPVKLDFLVKLKNLKELTCSFQMYGSPAFALDIRGLRILGEQNLIEKLSLYTSSSHFDPDNLAYLKYFTSLKCLEVSYPDYFHGFYSFLLSNLPSLKECCVVGSKKFSSQDVKCIVKVAKQMSTLKFKAPMTEFTANLYSNLLKIRKGSLNLEPLRLYIDQTSLTTFIKQLGRKYQPSIVELIPFNYK